MHLLDPWKGPVLTNDLGARSLHVNILAGRQSHGE